MYCMRVLTVFGLAGGADNTVKLWTAGASAASAAKPDQHSPGFGVRKTLRTKATPVFSVCFTRRNLLLAGGCLVPPTNAP